MSENEDIPSEANPETRLQKFLGRALPWVLTGLIAFGVGVLLIAFTLYIPTRQNYDAALTQLENAYTTINENKERISTLQAENDNLLEDLDTATLHWDLLEALSGVRGANLAVLSNDYAGARLLLIQGTESFDTLSGRLELDDMDVFNAMQQSAVEALNNMQIDLQSALPQLEQLEKNLVQLIENLFPNP